MGLSLTSSEYEAIVEQAPILIWRAGADAERDYFNGPWLAFRGKTLEQESGYGWAEGIHSDDLDHCIADYLEAYARRQVFETEYRLRRHDGEYRWMHDRSVPVHDNAGTFVGFVGSSTDVTDIIAARVKAFRHLDMLLAMSEESGSELRQLSSQQNGSAGMFPGEAVGDFNDMLTVIMGAGTLLQRQLHHDSDLEQIVEQILLSSERAAGLIRALAAFGGGNPGKKKLPLEAGGETNGCMDAVTPECGYYFRGETILLVDNDTSVRNSTRSILECVGYNVLTAATAEEALTLFKYYCHNIALVILDAIPAINSEQIHRRLRCMRPDVKILVTDDGFKGFPIGAGGIEEETPYISRSLDSLTLLGRVRKIIDA